VRAGVLADSAGSEAWLVSLLESLARLPEFEIVDLFLLPPRRDSPDAGPPPLFRKLDRWSRSGASGRFELTEFPATVRRHELHGAEGAGLAPGDRALIAAERLDVLLCAAAAPLSGDCANLARWGTWSFLLGEPGFAACRPPYWREVYEGRSVSRGFLAVHDQRFERGRVVESFATATVPSLRFTWNQPAPLAAAGAALGWTLLKAAERDAPPSGGEALDLTAAPPRWPSAAETLAFAARKLGRSAALRLRSRHKTLQWFTGVRPAPAAIDFENPARGASYTEIPAPPGHSYADPFIVEHDSRHWLFVEDWSDANRRACLACMEIDARGRAGAPVVILDQPYHLSYPQVFSHRGDFFMIPESSGSATVQLYRSTRFPFEWDLAAVLMEDAALVDTTVLFRDGKWYFFTSTSGQPEEAYLFTSDRLDGPWQYHPANPIGADTRRLRGAGAIISRQGALFRPVQDCALGYGHAIAFNEILRLSPSEYEERPAGGLPPTWAPGLAGTHTFNFDSAFEVVDGLRLVPQPE
jgi:hypothetical protein